MHFRPTKAIIDLSALEQNTRTIVKQFSPHTGVLAMVKADAYGHGVLPIARRLVQVGVTALGVATVEEGVELRRDGLRIPILVMGGAMGGQEEAAEVMIKEGLTPVIHSSGGVGLLDRLALKLKVKAKLQVHLKIDTGMGRMGVIPQALPQVLKKLKTASHLKVQGVMTHLAYRFDPDYTKQQTDLFEKSGNEVERVLGEVPVWHIANSAAVIQGEPINPFGGTKKTYWVRPGIMLYGIPPYPEFGKKVALKPVMSLVSKVVLVKEVPQGTKISYNCTFETKRPSRIGIVPIGYADGYAWGLSNKADILVEGRRVPVLGRVTMDMTVIDLTDVSAAGVGSETVLLGKQGKEEITADELGEKSGSFAYEAVCRVSKRMPRVCLK